MFFNQSTSLTTLTDAETIEQRACKLCLPTPKTTTLGGASVKIAFAGEMKTGKSTLVNALLGMQILPSSTLPCTVVIHKLIHGTSSSLSLHYKDGRVVEGRPVVELVNLTAKQGDHSELAYVTVCSPELPTGIEVIDTPGFNDPAPDRNALAASMMAEADAIVFVIDGAQALKGSEIPFLDQFLFKGSRKKTILCVNMVDALSKAEFDEVRKRIEGEVANTSSPIHGQPVFFVSGKEALKAGASNLVRQFDFEGVAATIREFSKLKPLLEKRRKRLYFRDAALGKKRALGMLIQTPEQQVQDLMRLTRRIDLVQEGVTKVLDGWKLLTTEIDVLINQRFSELSTEMVSFCNGAGASGAGATEYISEKFHNRQKELIEQLTAEIKCLVADKFASEISPHIESITSGKSLISTGTGDSQAEALNSQFDERQAMIVTSVLPMALGVVFGGVGLLAGLLAGYVAHSKAINSQKKAMFESVEVLIQNVSQAITALKDKYRMSLDTALKQTSDVIEGAFMAKIEALEYEIVSIGAERPSPEDLKKMTEELTKFISDVEKLLEETG